MTFCSWSPDEFHSDQTQHTWFTNIRFSIRWNNSLTRSLKKNTQLPGWLEDPRALIPMYLEAEEPTYVIKGIDWSDTEMETWSNEDDEWF